jgi:hypothetical protein
MGKRIKEEVGRKKSILHPADVSSSMPLDISAKVSL